MTTTPRVHGWISLALLPLAALMAMILWGPQKSLPVIPRPAEDAGVLRIAYTQNLLPDPHRRTFPLTPQNQFTLSLWEPLVECDPATGEPQPAAAQSWTWSSDRKELTLKLRADARWSNGDRVTAHDFVRGWLRLLHQQNEVAETLFPLRNAEAFHRGKLTDPARVGVQAIDDLTLRLQLNEVRSTLVAELADPLLSPLHAGSEQVLADDSYLRDPAALVTNGPFQLERANDGGFRLKACPCYHGRAEVRLAGLHFIRTDSRSLAPLLLAAGVVDVVAPMPYGAARDLPTQRGSKIATELVLGVNSVDINVTHAPLGDLRVRQALALALDRQTEINRFDPGDMVPAWSWVPGMPGRAGLVLLKEDAREAQRLLAAAGFPGGRGFPVLNMSLPVASRGDPFPPAWTERWFQVLGIRTHLTYETFQQRNRHVLAGDFDLFYGALQATVPDAGDLLGAFTLPLESSTTKWIEQDVTRLLDQAAAETGSVRLATLEKAERRAMAAVPAVPLMFERRQALLAAEVQGWYADPLARQSPRRLWLDPVPAGSFNREPRL